jgi:hypothetical protein
LQKLRRVDRATAQQHLAPRLRAAQYALLAIGHAHGAPSLGQHLVRQRVGRDRQVGPAHRGPQITHRRRAAAPSAHRHLQGAHTLLVGSVEIVVQRKAEFHGAGDEGVVQLVRRTQVADAQRTAGAVIVVGAAFLVFRLAEIRQHVVVRPAGIAHLAPEVEILLLAANVDQPVDGAGAAQHLAARPGHLPVVHSRHRLGDEVPADLLVVDITIEAGRDMDPRVAILAAGLQKQHSRAGIGGKPVRHHATGRAGAHDHEIIVLGIAHPHPPAFALTMPPNHMMRQGAAFPPRAVAPDAKPNRPSRHRQAGRRSPAA